MKITNIESFLTADSAVYVRVETDEGIVGYGEATNRFVPHSVFGMLEDLKPYLLGEDPLRTEYLWQTCFRSLFMRGGPATGSAISGIDLALWDIKGKYYDAPIYQLLGGLTRDRVRLYGHVVGRTPEELAANAKRRADSGVTAIRFRAFHDTDELGTHDHARGVRQQIECLEAVRHAIGEDVDIILECHGRYSPEWALALAKQAEQFRPLFMEDPIRHENPQMMANLRRHTTIPLATGERAHSKWDYRELVVNGYVDYLRPDINHCGGITEMKKIAAFAELYYIHLVPHNTQGPLGMAACMHTVFATDNIALVEAGFVNADSSTKPGDLVYPWPVVENGYALPPSGPGLGITVNEDLLRHSRPPEAKTLHPPKLKALDGSVRDW